MSDEDVVYTMDVDLDGSPKGEQIQIAGLGTFENGSSYDITRAEAEAYRSYNTRYETIVGENDEILGSTPELGPTLLQASKTMFGVEVTTSGSKSKEDEAAEDEEARLAALEDEDDEDDEDDGGDNDGN